MSDWQKLQDDLKKFTNEAFPASTVKSKMEHLKQEAQEVIDSDGKDLEEWADVTLLLMDGAAKAGLSMTDLFNAAAKKLQKNKDRKWSPPDNNGVVNHVR